MKECFRCKSSRIIKGATSELGGSTRQIFKPDHLKFLAVTLSKGVPLDAYACSECGLVWTETDPAALGEFVEKHCKPEVS